MHSGEAINTNFIVFGFIRSELEPTIYRTRCKHANHYIIDVVDILSGSDSIGCVMVSIVTYFADEHGFEFQSSQTKDYKIHLNLIMM